MTEETTKVLEELRGIVNSFVIRGSGVAGNIRNGYTVNPGSGQISSGSGGGTPPPVTSGACCPTEGDCFVSTQAICEAGGGTYQGDDTTCDPNPCCLPEGCGYPPFDDGIGGCWTTFNADCFGNFFYSGSTPCDSMYRTYAYTQNSTCSGCVEGNPPDICPLGCSETVYRREGGVCDRIPPEGCPGGTCTCAYDQTQFVEDLLPPPCP